MFSVIAMTALHDCRHEQRHKAQNPCDVRFFIASNN